MNVERVIETLESEWSSDDGFFWHIREGRYHSAEFERALRKITSLSIADETQLPRRVVSLVWYIPLFMRWQVERVQECGGDVVSYARAIDVMTAEVERLLGIP